MKKELEDKVQSAIRILQLGAEDECVEVSYSGGKDSDIILELAKMAGIRFRAIYKNTTIDPPGTIRHCQDNAVEIKHPELTFFQLVEKHGIPTRRARFCCSQLKEYKILDRAVQGIRRCESTKRAARYKETDPIICRAYGSKRNTAQIILPILNWTDNDVADFIAERHIQCHPLYYDEDGQFQVKRRLGCIGCPLQADAGKADYRQYPKMLRQLIISTIRWWDTHPNASSRQKFGSPYGLAAHNLFYNRYADWQADDNNLFEKRDWKKYLENYFKINLP